MNDHPCIFCGHQPEIFELAGNNGPKYAPWCPGHKDGVASDRRCPVSLEILDYYDTKEEAFAAWDAAMDIAIMRIIQEEE